MGDDLGVLGLPGLSEGSVTTNPDVDPGPTEVGELVPVHGTVPTRTTPPGEITSTLTQVGKSTNIGRGGFNTGPVRGGR